MRAEVPQWWPNERRTEGETRWYPREGLKIQDRRFAGPPTRTGKTALSREPWEEFACGFGNVHPTLFLHPVFRPLQFLLSSPQLSVIPSLCTNCVSFFFPNLPAFVQPATTCEGSKWFRSGKEIGGEEREGEWRARANCRNKHWSYRNAQYPGVRMRWCRLIAVLMVIKECKDRKHQVILIGPLSTERIWKINFLPNAFWFFIALNKSSIYISFTSFI